MPPAVRQIPSAAAYGLIELANAAGLCLQVLPQGELFAIRHGPTLINQVLPTPVERGLRRLVLRERGPDGFVIVDLADASAAFQRVDDWRVRWSGARAGWEYAVTLDLQPDLPLWQWQVRIRNVTGQARVFDLLHGQDLGLADEASVRGNEAFISQYIDHSPLAHARWGTILCSRQNLPQAHQAHPWIAHGCLTGARFFATDGYQFFGLGHRLTGIPDAWQQERLAGRRQYEFAYAALQTAPVTLLPGGEWKTTFFAVYQPDHAVASGEGDLELVEELLAKVQTFGQSAVSGESPVAKRPSSIFQALPIAGDECTEAELREWFPGEWRQVERDGAGQVLSFFFGAARHVVTRRKEAAAERPHGHLLRSGCSLWLDGDTLGSTVYAAGIYNAQVYLGNTNLARALSVVRNSLDAMTASGQRVFVQHRGGWRRLGIPSAFSIGLDEARWIYRLGETCIEAISRMDPDAPRATLTLRVTDGAPCAFLLSHLLVMGEREMDQGIELALDSAAARLVCAPDPDTFLGRKLPELQFAIQATVPADVAACGGDELLFADGVTHQAPFAVLRSRPVREFAVVIEAVARLRPGAGGQGSRGCCAGLPRLRHPAAAHVDEILPWFAHNAWTHVTAPRGLEQYGGAAWGVRDVSQGPLEWLIATRQFAPVRRLLLQLFAQQYEGTGCWPQWFMLPPFQDIQSVQAHGDVPFWPVKALCDYVEATGDFAVLDEPVVYTDVATFGASARRESLLVHALRAMDVWESRRIPGTALVTYGEGDWDDTLQPADPALRANMVSSWTVALAFQVFAQLNEICRRADRREAAERLAPLLAAMRVDFQRLLLPDGVLAGFLVFGGKQPQPLLHPRDSQTGIRYRLLPMTRAMLAGLLTPEQARRHMSLIHEHLLFQDGVRLMSDPVPYRGGVTRWFQRAETAANFGREIGLMYTHAHLRYVEALARLGLAEELWEMLGRVTPVQLHERVRNAVARQANAFFSSSDGAFADRYEAAARFDDLRRGKVEVAGGWRIYSSGPGLYIHRVVCGMLGLRDSFGDVVIDPVLPRTLDGLVVEVERDGRRIEFQYQVGSRGFGVRRVCVNGKDLPLDRRENNPYREGGMRIEGAAFAAEMNAGKNRVEISVA